MAGLIQQQMASANEAGEREPVEGQGPDGSAMHEQMEGEPPEADDNSTSEEDPNYQQAIGLAMKALYGEQAAKHVANSLKGAPDLVEGLSNTAYEITSIIDERTEGKVPDELLALLATNVLQEVCEIADAAGLGVTPADTAMALKQMILRFLGEQGVDTTQLEQAMGQVDPEEFNRMAAAPAEQEGEEVPV